jgi:glycosyltransferase involved in cell wall biosynthesis
VLYIWRPRFAPALLATKFDVTCYHIDDEYSFSESEVPIAPAEHRLIRSVDHVFIHSPALFEKKGRINPNTTISPNGVNFKAYALPGAEPMDLAKISRPRIGYTGYLKQQLNWPLLEKLILRRPDWHFVFVGPVAPHNEARLGTRRLADLPNAYFLGGKSVEEVARYPSYFDVCVLPYRKDAYTNYIYPLKLHEYLASGTPTVGARIRSLEDFENVVLLADSVDEWLKAISSALDPELSGAQSRERRQATARKHDWDLLVERIAATLAGYIRPEYKNRIINHRVMDEQ